MKISIIVATYNADKTLRRCLDSIVSQKTSEIELLIIDGGSTDGTTDIVCFYKEQVDYFVSEPDRGIYDAWNKGIRKASGQWIMFLGADDFLLSDSISIYLDFLRSHQVEGIDIISGRCCFINETGRVLRTFGNPYKWSEFRKYMKISHGSTLHNSALFKELGEFSLTFKICADYEFLLRRPLKSLYIDRELIAMQDGGMSNTLKGLYDGFRVKKYRKSIPISLNFFFLVKGFVGFYYRKLKSNIN